MKFKFCNDNNSNNDVNVTTVSSSSSAPIGGDVPRASLSLQLIVDQVVVMKAQEKYSYRYNNYLEEPFSSKSESNIRSCWREKICHWSYSVVDHFLLSRETVAISMSIFDRYLATLNQQIDDEETVLLTSLTALNIALKLKETRRIHIDTLCRLSKGRFTSSEIEAMEWKILLALSFHVNPPTAVTFASHLLHFLPRGTKGTLPTFLSNDIREITAYLAELSVCESCFVDEDASAVACAAIVTAIETSCRIRRIPSRVSSDISYAFMQGVSGMLNLDPRGDNMLRIKERLRFLYDTNMGGSDVGTETDEEQDDQLSSSRENWFSSPLCHQGSKSPCEESSSEGVGNTSKRRRRSEKSRPSPTSSTFPFEGRVSFGKAA